MTTQGPSYKRMLNATYDLLEIWKYEKAYTTIIYNYSEELQLARKELVNDDRAIQCFGVVEPENVNRE